MIDEGAHHVDLMFSRPDDAECITNARIFERDQILVWIEQKFEKYGVESPRIKEEIPSEEEENGILSLKKEILQNFEFFN